MSEIKDGGPAFPVELDWSSGEPRGKQTDNRTGWHEGISTRDYFAAKALAALINHPNKDGENCGGKAVPKLAEWAYEYADAMLKARSA